MKLEFLEAHQTEQLSACQLSLILGVYTTDNKIERYLRVARAVLNVENAFFTFHNEPYIWVADESSDFKAASIACKLSLSPYFGNQCIVSEMHKNYEKFSQYMVEIG